MTDKKVAVIIPIYHPDSKFNALLQKLHEQKDIAFDLYIVDSGSTLNDYEADLEGLSYHIEKTNPQEFNHGGTRRKAAEQCKGYPFLIYMTQDAIPADEYALAHLIALFEKDAQIGCAYGRQLPNPDASVMAAHARLFNYPEKSQLKELKDAKKLGIKAAFLSDTFAAYRNEALQAVGNFPLARWLEAKPHLLENHAICFLFNPDEELSSIYSRPVIEELAKKSDYAFVLEPSMEENTLVKGRRGVARFYLDFHGIASHAGSAPEKGASAIHEFIRWGEILLKENKPCEGTNLNIGMVSGGTAANIIADHCSGSVDMRMTDIRKGEHLEELLHDLASRPFDLRVLTTIRGGITRPPYGNPDMEELLAREVTAYFALKGKEIHWKTVGSASDGNFTSALGVPTIDALGPMGGGAHTPGEYGVVHDILPKFEILTELTAYVLGK